MGQNCGTMDLQNGFISIVVGGDNLDPDPYVDGS